MQSVGPTNNDDYECKWLTNGIPWGQAFANYNDLMDHLGRVHRVQGSATRKLDCQGAAGGTAGMGLDITSGLKLAAQFSAPTVADISLERTLCVHAGDEAG